MTYIFQQIGQNYHTGIVTLLTWFCQCKRSAHWNFADAMTFLDIYCDMNCRPIDLHPARIVRLHFEFRWLSPFHEYLWHARSARIQITANIQQFWLARSFDCQTKVRVAHWSYTESNFRVCRTWVLYAPNSENEHLNYIKNSFIVISTGNFEVILRSPVRIWFVGRCLLLRKDFKGAYTKSVQPRPNDFIIRRLVTL